MKKGNIIYKNFFNKEHLNFSIGKKLNDKYKKVLREIENKFNIENNYFYSLNNNFKLNFRLEDIKRFKRFNNVVIIGMGGSVLGAEAIYNFIENKNKKNFYFINDVNEENFKQIKEKKLNKVLYIVISKSGETIETLSNFYFLRILKKNSKNIIIITEKKHNHLYSLSKSMKLFHIEHKNYIGGRYSVLSEVGMLPALLMGANIRKLRSNLLKKLKLKNNIFLKESTIKLTNLLQQGCYNNLVFCNYEPRLKKFLEWKQQLVAESLGKKGKGFFPTISKMPKDHHSMMQLYLDGPKDKIFYIFSSIVKDKKKIRVNNYNQELKYLKNKTLNNIKEAQKNAFIGSLKKRGIPFREIKIKGFSEEYLGELFSYFMLEVIIIGMLNNVNPFNQKAVEEIKIKTRNLLL